MTYAPQPADIGLVRMGGWGGRLIHLGQGLNGSGWEDYEHSFIYLGDGQVIQAEPGGAVIAPLTRAPVYWCRFTPLPNQRTAIVAAARGYAGVGYAWPDYGAIALHRFGIRDERLKDYIQDSGHMICSQLCDRAYNDAGYRIFSDGRWDGDVTPGDLYKASQKMGLV